MDDARSALRNGSLHGTVCRAGSQDAGRGRIPGRLWEDGGESLLFTVILDRSRFSPSYPPTQLMALCLCRRLESAWGLRPRIKWPNDVLVDGRKIAGILVETEGDFFLAGMGLNIGQDSFPDGLRRPAVSLARAAAECGASRRPRPDAEFTGLMMELDRVLDEAPPIGEISRRIDGLGRAVAVKLGDPSRNETLEGVLEGLGEDGALLVRDGTGVLHPVYSGEIG